MNDSVFWAVVGAGNGCLGFFLGSKYSVAHFDPVMDMIPSIPFIVGFAFFSGVAAYLDWGFQRLVLLNVIILLVMGVFAVTLTKIVEDDDEEISEDTIDNLPSILKPRAMELNREMSFGKFLPNALNKRN